MATSRSIQVRVTDHTNRPIEGARVSARNRYRGTVQALHLGPLNAEVTLALPGGQHTLTAVITRASVDRLRLSVGQPVTALFKASSVFLVVND